MPPLATWIARVQAVALVGLAIAVVVLAATSTTALGLGFVITEVVALLLVALLLGVSDRHRRVRVPILLLEIIAVGVAGQLVSVHRPLAAALVGLPALVAGLSIVAGARAAD